MSIKILEIRTLIVFNLSFRINTILSCIFFFFIINLYFIILAVIEQILIQTAELVIPTGKASNEAKGKIEMHPVTIEAELCKCSTSFKYLHIFLYFSLIKSSFIKLSFISSKRFLVSSVFVNLNFRLASSVTSIFKILIYYFVILFIVIQRKQISIF